MMRQFITHNGVDIEVTEPTVKNWMDLTALQDFKDNNEFAVELISISTGLTPEDIKQHNWYDIQSVAANLSDYFLNQSNKFFKEFEFKGTKYGFIDLPNLSDYFLNQSNKFFKEFEFKGTKYGFIDLPNLSFGEFIDIDTFLSKSVLERKRELHYHMALLYRELDTEGKLVPYDSGKVEARANLFKELPILYVNGALHFFFHLEMELRKHSTGYLKRLMWIKTLRMRVMILNLLLRFGVGILRLMNWLKTISQRFLKSSKPPLSAS